MNRRIVLILIVIGCIIAAGISQFEPSASSTVSARAQFELPPADISAFARAIDPWDWQFPRDHGSHPAFQTEWWYYTGNLADADGRRFGFQFTIFRRALSGEGTESTSEFRANQVYMAHFTVSDIAGGQLLSRPAIQPRRRGTGGRSDRTALSRLAGRLAGRRRER